MIHGGWARPFRIYEICGTTGPPGHSRPACPLPQLTAMAPRKRKVADSEEAGEAPAPAEAKPAKKQAKKAAEKPAKATAPKKEESGSGGSSEVGRGPNGLGCARVACMPVAAWWRAAALVPSGRHRRGARRFGG